MVESPAAAGDKVVCARLGRGDVRKENRFVGKLGIVLGGRAGEDSERKLMRSERVRKKSKAKGRRGGGVFAYKVSGGGALISYFCLTAGMNPRHLSSAGKVSCVSG